MVCLLPHVQLPESEFHTTSMFDPPQMVCICKDTFVVSQGSACSEPRLQLPGLAGAVQGVHGDRPRFLSAGRPSAMFQSCRGCDGNCWPHCTLWQNWCGRWEPGHLWEESLLNFYLRSSALSLWFLNGMCLQLLFLLLPGGSEKINETKEHSKPSFRLWLLGGFDSQTRYLPCFCGSQNGQWRWITWQSAL